jgi:hypothetical protein
MFIMIDIVMLCWLNISSHSSNGNNLGMQKIALLLKLRRIDVLLKGSDIPTQSQSVHTDISTRFTSIHIKVYSISTNQIN